MATKWWPDSGDSSLFAVTTSKISNPMLVTCAMCLGVVPLPEAVTSSEKEHDHLAVCIKCRTGATLGDPIRLADSIEYTRMKKEVSMYRMKYYSLWKERNLPDQRSAIIRQLLARIERLTEERNYFMKMTLSMKEGKTAEEKSKRRLIALESKIKRIVRENSD